MQLRPRGTFEGAGGSSPAAVGRGVCRGGTGGVGVGTAKTWDPCGVAGIRLKVGGGAGPTVGAGTGTGLLTEAGGGGGFLEGGGGGGGEGGKKFGGGDVGGDVMRLGTHGRWLHLDHPDVLLAIGRGRPSRR